MIPRRIILSRALAAVATVCIAHSTLAEEKASDANRAKNLARLNCGAHIDRILPGGRIDTFAGGSQNAADPSALLLDDNTLSCALSVGDNVFVVTLPHISMLQRFSFINRNAAAEGEFEVAVSNYRLGSTDSAWAGVQKATTFSKERLINLSMPGVEARYVRLTFHVRKEGQLAALALYGIPTLENFSRLHVLKANSNYSLGGLTLVTHLSDTLNFNYANQYAQGRIVYVSSSGADWASRMIDDDAATSFSFAADDPHPTVVVALANRQRLHRISSISQMADARVEVYLLDGLGADPGDLSHARLISSAVGKNSDGTWNVTFEAQRASYVALRWVPEHPHRPHQAIEVAEINAFGTIPLSVVDLTEQPEMLAQGAAPGTLVLPPIPSVSP
jgi:hypothetical protein